MELQNDKKPTSKGVFAYFVLNQLGCGHVNNFKERLESQKVQYIAQVFKVAPFYNYNLYIHGPYSPGLADDLYKLNRSHIKIKPSKFVSDELKERFAKLKEFLKNKNLRQLEIITTLHWLLNEVELSNDKAKDKLIELKNANSEEVKFAFVSIKNIPR
jgi:uncharacterized protein YwgA